VKRCLNTVARILEILGGISLILILIFKLLGFITWEQFWESAIIWPVITYIIGFVLGHISQLIP